MRLLTAGADCSPTTAPDVRRREAAVRVVNFAALRLEAAQFLVIFVPGLFVVAAQGSLLLIVPSRN